MRIEEQDTQPLLVLPFKASPFETSAERFRRLKTLSELTGVRLLFIYLSDERRREQQLQKAWQTPCLPCQSQSYSLRASRRVYGAN